MRSARERTVRAMLLLTIIFLFSITFISASEEKVGEGFFDSLFAKLGSGALLSSIDSGCVEYKRTVDYPKAGEIYVTYTLDDEEVKHILYASSKDATNYFDHSCESYDFHVHSEKILGTSHKHTVNFPFDLKKCYKLERIYYKCEVASAVHKTESYYCDYRTYGTSEWKYGNRYSQGESDTLGKWCSDPNDNSYRDYLGKLHCSPYALDSWCTYINANYDSSACYKEGGRVLSDCFDYDSDRLWKIEEGSSKGMWCCTSPKYSDIPGDFVSKVGSDVGKTIGSVGASATGSFISSFFNNLWQKYNIFIVIIVVILFILVFRNFFKMVFSFIPVIGKPISRILP